MNAHEAREAIAAILEQVPTGQLPEPTKVEEDRHDEYGTCYWFGSHGFYAGATRDGKGDSITANHRRDGIQTLLERESMQRIENEHWAAKSEVAS